MTLEQSKTQPDTGASRQLDSLMQLNTALMNGCIDGFQSCMQGVLDLHQEFVRFVSKRVECDLGIAQSFAQCRNWTDLTRIQQDWSREAAEDYTVESSKVMQLTSRTANESVKTLREPATATMRERTAA